MTLILLSVQPKCVNSLLWNDDCMAHSEMISLSWSVMHEVLTACFIVVDVFVFTFQVLFSLKFSCKSNFLCICPFDLIIGCSVESYAIWSIKIRYDLMKNENG